MAGHHPLIPVAQRGQDALGQDLHVACGQPQKPLPHTWRNQVRLETTRTPSSTDDDVRAKLLLNADWCGRCCRNDAH